MPDEIHYLPPTPPVYNILGGGGTYAALGARLLSPPPVSKTVSWIVDQGSDFPSDLLAQIASWETSCLLRNDPTRLTTHGWNGYETNGTRAFKYTTPKLRLDETSLTPALLFSKSFHIISSPTRASELITSILRLRKIHRPNTSKPLIIWEPVPDLCLPSELLNLTNVLPYIDILSPNHSELAAFMGDPNLGHDPETGLVDRAAVERVCEQLLGSMPLQSYAIVVRCGALGCFIAKNGGRSRRPSLTRQRRPANHARGGLTLDMDMSSIFSSLLSPSGEIEFERETPPVDPGIEKWLPAYWMDGEKVVDPTGGGNTFLGGLAVGLARGKGIVEAAAWGSIAASFAIEQVGCPVLRSDKEGRETWNGCAVEGRLDEFLRRIEI